MMLQQFNLVPHITVGHNVMIGPRKLRGMTEAAARDLAAGDLRRGGIPEKAREYPARLSGGQQQRVAIARALAMATLALDPELVGEVLLAMRRFSEEGMTLIVVTHELGFACNVADRVVFLEGRRVHEEGMPRQVLLGPQRERTREFLRSHTLFRLPDARGAAHT
jgi:polar amino acid transport system ATP-binding protein